MNAEHAASWTVPLDHPAFAGHFPGRPILPGVVLLDRVLHLLATASGRATAGAVITNAKFLSPVGPGETLRFAWQQLPSGGFRFDVAAGARAVASGLLSLPS